jgi:hypothetical protein
MNPDTWGLFVKRVYVGQHPTDVDMLCDLLEVEGIPAVTGWGADRILEPPSVWILHDADFARAMEVVEEYSRPVGPKYDWEAAWQCGRCGEKVEAPYDACWKCSAPRPEPPTSTSSPERVDDSSQSSSAPIKPKAVLLAGLPFKLSLIVFVALVLFFIRGLPQTAWILYFAAALLVIFDHVARKFS